MKKRGNYGGILTWKHEQMGYFWSNKKGLRAQQHNTIKPTPTGSVSSNANWRKTIIIIKKVKIFSVLEAPLLKSSKMDNRNPTRPKSLSLCLLLHQTSSARAHNNSSSRYKISRQWSKEKIWMECIKEALKKYVYNNNTENMHGHGVKKKKNNNNVRILIEEE